VIYLSRKHRVEFKGAMYHVFQRGNNKEYIFKNDIEKGFFIKQIKEYMNLYNYEILAFTMMDNHYHLIIRTNEIPLSKIMHSINNIYCKFYNYHHMRTGHVFEERYNSKLIEDDAYLIWLLKYIHRNPVRAHICENAEDYKWSSDNLYRRNRKVFVNIDFILNIFSSKRSEAIRTYIKLVNSPEEIDKEREYKIIEELWHGNSFFSHQLMNNEEDITNRTSLDEILANMDLGKVDIDLLKKHSRKRYLTEIKVEFIRVAIDNKYSFKEIGEFLGVTQPAISSLLISNGFSNYVVESV
jgi:putative transposase